MIWDDARFVAVRVAHNRQTSESFWARVDRTGDGCWEWQGAVNNSGYGSVGWHGHVRCAHRVAAYLSGLVDDPAQPKNRKGPGHVLHRCDNRRCCRPEHLFVGTYTDNMCDMYSKGRHPVYRGSTHTNAKLTDDQVRAAREAYSTTPDYAALGRRFGVHETTMANVIKRRTYVHVD